MKVICRSAMKKFLLAVIVCASLLDLSSADDCKEPTECIATTMCMKKHRDANSDLLSTLLIFRCHPGKVCCPPIPVPARISGPHKNMKLLPEDCGPATGDRIFEGKNASLGQFPWMALIGVRVKRQPSIQHICGGSVIAERYVLTAAHCVNSSDIIVVHVRLGEHDQSTSPDCRLFINETQCADPVMDILVEKVITHQLYVETTLKNDIALIRVKTAIPFTEYIQPICLPFGINETGAEGKKYMVSGWGRLNGNRGSPASPLLQWTKVSGLSTVECNEQQTSSATPLDSSQLCADDALGSDACQGDSGGPLIDIQKGPTKLTAHAYVIGIVSYGFRNCEMQNSPTAYSRVYYYLNWILDHIAR